MNVHKWLCVYAILLAVVIGAFGCDTRSHRNTEAAATKSITTRKVRANPLILEFGKLKVSKNGMQIITVINDQSQNVRIYKIVTSCECLRSDPNAFELRPGESVQIAFVYEPEKDVVFKGQLSIKIEFLGEDEQVILAMTANIEVSDDD